MSTAAFPADRGAAGGRGWEINDGTAVMWKAAEGDGDACAGVERGRFNHGRGRGIGCLMRGGG